LANEILYSGLGDLRLAEVLSQEVLLALADRNAIMQHPALVYAGDASGSGSTTIKVGEIGWMGYDSLAAVAEGATVANTALTDASHTVSVARQAKAYAPSDLAKLTDSIGHLSPSAFAQDAAVSAGVRLTELIAALVGGFTATAGVSGSDLTVAQFYAAIAQLETSNVASPFFALLHPQQWADLRVATQSETGPLQLDPASLEMQQARGNGFKGSVWGVDVFTSSHVPTANAGADRAGGMFGRGALIWADAMVPPDPAVVGINMGKVLLELDRSGRTAETAAITNFYCGAAEAIDAAGVSIITDA